MTALSYPTTPFTWVLCMLLSLAVIGETRAADKGTASKDMALFETYQGMLDEDPYQPYAFRRLLEVSHVVGGLEGLISRYQARVEGDEHEGPTWVVLAHLYHAAERQEDAIAAYQYAAKIAGKDWRPHHALARLYRRSRLWPLCFAALDAAISKTKRRDDLTPLYQEGIDAALEAKDLSRAAGYVSALRKRASKQVFLHMEAAATYSRRGFPRESLAAWKWVQERHGKALKHLVVIWRQVATLQEELGDLDAAEATWREGLRRLKGAHWARPSFLEGLVSVYRRRDMLPALIAELEATTLRDRNVMLTLAQLHEELGRDLEAKGWLERALSLRKRDIATRLRLIRVLERTGPTKALMTQHETLVALSDGEPGHALKLAALYFQKDMSKKGFKLIDRLAKRYASDPGVHQRIIDLTMRYGGIEERSRIERSYRSLLRLEPNEESHIISLGEYWWSHGEKEEALKTWHRLKKVGTKRGAGHLLYAEVLADHALIERATKAFDEALEVAPKDPRILSAYARFLEGQKEQGAALKLWRQVLKREPGSQKSTDARRQIVKLWAESGRLHQEQARLREQFKGPSPELEAGFLLVEVLLVRRDHQGAQEVLERLRTLAPERRETLIALERLYTRKDQVDDAIEVLETLARLHPREAYDYLHRAADLSLGRGDLKGALERTRRVIALNPAVPSAHERVGDLYRRMGSMREAVAAWRQVLLLDPRNDAVRFKLADLYRALDAPARERQELIHIVRETSQPSDALKAGRRLLQVAIASGGLRDVEDALRPLAIRKAERSDVYLKLLIDTFVAETRALRWSEGASKEALDALGERALKPLMRALVGSDVALRARALEVIRATRPTGAVPALSRILLEQGNVARVSITAALGAIGSVSAIEALKRLYEGTKGHAQRIAIWAMGLSNAPEALTALSEIATSRQPQDRILAAWALGARADRRAIPTLNKLAKSGDGRQRIAALWALGQSPFAEITGSCATSLRSKDPLERQLASQALSRIGTEAAQRLLIQELWRADEHPEGHLAEALTHQQGLPSEERRQSAYMALINEERERLNEDRAPLISASALAPTPPEMRLGATRSLIPLLKAHIEALLAGDSIVRIQALLEASIDDDDQLTLRPLLSHEHAASEVQSLVNALWSSSHTRLWDLASGKGGARVQAGALALLAALRDVAFDTAKRSVIKEALNSPWSTVQTRALTLLSRDRHADSDADRAAHLAFITAWYSRRTRSTEVRRVMAKALERLPIEDDAQTLTLIKTLLDDPDTEVRLSAVATSRALDHPELLSQLADRLNDPVAEVARAAVEALRASAHERAQTLLNALRATHGNTPLLRTRAAHSPTPP